MTVSFLMQESALIFASWHPAQCPEHSRSQKAGGAGVYSKQSDLGHWVPLSILLVRDRWTVTGKQAVMIDLTQHHHKGGLGVETDTLTVHTVCLLVWTTSCTGL